MLLTLEEKQEHLMKALAHLNCALEHLDHVPLQSMFTYSDKSKMKNFLDVGEKKAMEYIKQAYKNEEMEFQALQNALSKYVKESIRETIYGDTKGLSGEDSDAGQSDAIENGDGVSVHGSEDGEDANSPSDGPNKES